MADVSRAVVPVDPAGVLVFGTGGEARTRAEYKNGERTDATVKRGGVDVRRLSGVAVSIGGVGYDGATVETTTALENVPAGTIFAADGECEIAFRADARAGFGGGGPRGVLIVSVYVERLTPLGTAAELVAGRGTGKRGAA